MPEPRAITEIAERAAMRLRRKQSLAALNNMIMLLAHDFTMEEVAQILRDHADQIDELG